MTQVVFVALVAAVVVLTFLLLRREDEQQQRDTAAYRAGKAAARRPTWTLMFFGGPRHGERTVVPVGEWLTLAAQIGFDDGAYVRDDALVSFPDGGGLAQYQWVPAREVAA